MKNLLFYFLLISVIAKAQNADTLVLKQNLAIAAKAQFICIWGDSKRMELHTNGRIYQFKSGLEDGMYTAFFDKKFKDTAMVVVIQNGEINGLLQRWYTGKIEEECQYKNGKMYGWRKLYFYPPEGGRLVNIQYVDENEAVKEVQTEW